MPLKLNLGLKQKLTMTHRMQQSLSLLSLSHEELNQAIQQELLENPLLEAVEPEDSDKKNLGNFNFRMHDSLEADFKKHKKSSPGPVEDQIKEPVSLKSHVLKQAEMSFFPKKIKMTLPLLISYLDERGYLDLDIRDLSKREGFPLGLLEESLKALQSLEPAGIGGRNLKECLLIQLRHKKGEHKKANLIVEQHLQNIRKKKYKLIAYDLNISIQESLRLCRLIQSLEPIPARNFSSQPTVFIRPDLYIYKHQGDYHVIFNKEDLPGLRFSSQYVKSIRGSGKLKPMERKYLNEKTSAAHWFIRAIRQRQEKIKKIASYIIEQQRDFLEKGETFLKPLKMQDLAYQLDVHVSTISRALQGKYAHTPQGIVALKSFFQKGLMTETGSFVAISQIKSAIKKWIAEENPKQPLSDRDIRDKIYEVFNIQLLRRSVSQYRDSMDIPSIRTRQLHFLSLQSPGA